MAVKPEQTHHTRFHLPRPTLTHKLPAQTSTHRSPSLFIPLATFPCHLVYHSIAKLISPFPFLVPSFPTCSIHFSSLATSLPLLELLLFCCSVFLLLSSFSHVIHLSSLFCTFYFLTLFFYPFLFSSFSFSLTPTSSYHPLSSFVDPLSLLSSPAQCFLPLSSLTFLSNKYLPVCLPPGFPLLYLAFLKPKLLWLMAIIYSLHLPFETPLLSHVFIVLEVPKNWKVAGLIPYDHQELDIPERHEDIRQTCSNLLSCFKSCLHA